MKFLSTHLDDNSIIINGTSSLAAGTNITITSASNGVVTVALNSTLSTIISGVIQTLTGSATIQYPGYYFANSPGSMTITLPSSPFNQLIATLKLVSTGSLFISGNGKNIDGESIVTASVRYDSVTVVFNETLNQWFIA